MTYFTYVTPVFLTRTLGVDIGITPIIQIRDLRQREKRQVDVPKVLYIGLRAAGTGRRPAPAINYFENNFMLPQ